MEIRTLLEMANKIATRLRFDELSVLIGNTDKNAIYIRDCLVDGYFRDVCRKKGSWAIFRRPNGSVAFTKGKGQYELPADFDYILNDTAWDTQRRRPAIGSLKPYEWAQVRGLAGVSTAGGVIYFTIGGPTVGIAALETRASKYIYVYPVPEETSSGAAFTFSYVSDLKVGDSSGSAKKRFTADDDVPLLDSDMVELAGTVRALRGLGLGFADEAQELKALMKVDAGRDGGATRLQMDYGGTRVLRSNTPGYSRARRFRF